MTTTSQETVVVIHGLGGHWAVMHPLCQRLRGRGYHVVNWGYRSFWRDIQAHANDLEELLRTLEADPQVSRIHIVAHSMGSIVTRVLLSQLQPSKLSRIVMIGPPNSGARVATAVAPLIGWISTTVKQITTKPDSYVNQLDAPIDRRYQLGIVKASRDLVVAKRCTELPEAVEYAVLPGFHSSILIRPSLAAGVDRFLQSGSFSEVPPSEPLVACPKLPNCVSTRSSNVAQAMPPLVFQGNAEDAAQEIIRCVLELPRSELVVDDSNYLRFAFTSRFLRFVDDVEFQLDASKQLVHFRSASRIGFSDFGVNRKRMSQITEHLVALHSQFSVADNELE